MLKDMNNDRMVSFCNHSSVDCMVVLSVGKKSFQKSEFNLDFAISEMV